MKNSSSNLNRSGFFILTSVFFFWGFVAASNDILIPVFKSAFNLSQSQSQLVSLAFYIAYTVGSIIYMFISKLMKEDIINKLGYKNALAAGLGISALGTLLFYPAAETRSFELMLSGLFIVGLGFSLQQTVANPLAIALGPLTTGSQRLTLAGGVNNFGTTIGPLIVSFAIFGAVSANNTVLNIENVKIPYLILGAAFLVVAAILKLSSLPNKPIDSSNTIDTAMDSINLVDSTYSAASGDNVVSKNIRNSALHYPQLVLGMIAIFVYVGVEVATASNLPAYMEQSLKFNTKDIAPYISLYWASLMIGRWTGAVEAFTAKAKLQKILRIIAPYLAFVVFLLANIIAGRELSPFYIYAWVIGVLIAADYISKGNPARMLLIFSIFGVVALITGMLTSGMISVYAFISVGLFCSTLWPCIFTLAIAGLGKHTTSGSIYLIMIIMGGGVISYLQGVLADESSIQFSYIVGVLCFVYLAFYAIKAASVLKAQGVHYDKNKQVGH